MLSFFRSFRFALRGLALCLRERNFRFHLSLALFVYGFLIVPDWFVLTRSEWAALLLATVLVLAAEAFNTAIEATVDLACPEQHPLAARAKDIGAGAVLLCSLGALAAGIVVLWQPEAFQAMFDYFTQNLLSLAALLFVLVCACAFIFGIRKKKT